MFILPPLIVFGGLVAYACFELDFSNGAMLYGFYLMLTILLRWTAGLGWIWQSVPDILPT